MLAPDPTVPDSRDLVARILKGMSDQMTGQASTDVPTANPDGLQSSPALIEAAPAPTSSDTTEPTPSPSSTPSPTGGKGGDVETFMAAMSPVESGGNSHATNGRTGAHGTFQILPSNWPTWAKAAGVDPADDSPEAQATVARHKMLEYHDALGSWGAVAVAWYAGPAAAAAWVKNPDAPRFNKKQGPTGAEPSINEYVAKIMHGMGGS